MTEAIIGPKSKDIWMRKAKLKLKDLINTIPLNEYFLLIKIGSEEMEEAISDWYKDRYATKENVKDDMWLEWELGFINLDHVKRIFFEEGRREIYSPDIYIGKIWKLHVVMTNDEGHYAKYYETEEEVQEEYARLKSLLMA